jgi:hypothetical protein
MATSRHAGPLEQASCVPRAGMRSELTRISRHDPAAGLAAATALPPDAGSGGRALGLGGVLLSS